MKCAGIAAYRGPVQLMELPEPKISDPHQLIIEVYAAGVGKWDDIVRTGGWDVGGRPPMALGVEAAGLVHAVGTAVSRFRVGDEVLVHAAPLQYHGAWAEMFLVLEDHVARKPPGMPFPVAGLFPVPALTAQQALAAVAPERGEKILIHGAGGVTGGMLVAVAATMGGWVIATAGSASSERVRGYGADVVLDYHEPDWPEEVQHLTGGVRVAVNAVPGAAESVMPVVVDGGHLATITGDPPPSERHIQVSNVYVSPNGSDLEQVAAGFVQRGLTIPITGVYGLLEAGNALSRVVSGGTAGGVVIDPRR